MMINNNKKIFKIIEDMDFESIFSIHLFFSISKNGNGKTEVIDMTQKMLMRGVKGKKRVNKIHIEEINKIHLEIDEWVYGVEEIKIDNEILKYVGKTSVAGAQSIMRNLLLFDMEDYYHKSNLFIKLTDINDISSILENIQILKIDIKTRDENFVISNGIDCYLPITPYFAIKSLEKINFFPWEKNTFKFEKQEYRKFDYGSPHAEKGVIYISDLEVTNTKGDNGFILLSSKEL